MCGFAAVRTGYAGKHANAVCGTLLLACLIRTFFAMNIFPTLANPWADIILEAISLLPC